jgi:hypothetical protein
MLATAAGGTRFGSGRGSTAAAAAGSSSGGWASISSRGRAGSQGQLLKGTCTAGGQGSEAQPQQQLVHVHLLVPALEVCLPLLPADAAAAAGDTAAPGATPQQQPLSSDGKQRRRSSGSTGGRGGESAADRESAPPTSSSAAAAAAAAGLLQGDVSKALGVDPSQLAFYALEQAELPDLLLQQQGQQQGQGQQQPTAGRAQQQREVATVVVGLRGSSCSFSLGSLELLLSDVATHKEEAEALRATNQQLQVCAAVPM